MVLLLKKFICCISLRTGSIVVGVLWALAGIALLAWFIRECGMPSANIGNAEIGFRISLYLSTILLSILMIVGVAQKNWKLIVPWLVLDGLLIGFALLFLLYMIFVAIVVGHFAGFVAYFWVIILGTVLLIVLSMYFWYVPFSYHFELKETET